MSRRIVRRCFLCDYPFAAERGNRSGMCSLACRFNSKIDLEGPVPLHRPALGPCHLWLGSRMKNGYGQFRVESTTLLAHRVAWYLSRGAWPAQLVCHACDGGELGCVRREHLFAGNQNANMSDCAAKERGSSKLTEVDVRDIIAMRRAGETLEALARRYGVVKSTISNVHHRRTWKHIP